jgi:hypothetical protein
MSTPRSTYTALDARKLSFADLGATVTLLVVLLIVVMWQASAALRWDDVVARTVGFGVPWLVLIVAAITSILGFHYKRPVVWIPILAIVGLSIMHALLG